MQTNKNDKLAYWKQKLQEYRKSGLSRRTFSEQTGVNNGFDPQLLGEVVKTLESL